MTDQTENAAYRAGALPPFMVTHIRPEIVGGGTERWFVMGTVNGDPRDQCGPVAICEWEPSAHEIADLLNERFGPSSPKSWLTRLWSAVIARIRADGGAAEMTEESASE